MTEELSLEQQLQQATEEQQQSSSPEIPDNSKEEVELSIEDQARSKGWKPKEEFEGDEELWVPAETYLDRGPFIKQIVKLNRLVDEQKEEMRKQKEALGQVKDMMTKAEKAGYEKAKQELNKQLDTAIQRGDTYASKKIIGELEELRTKQLPQQQTQESSPNPDPEVAALLERRPYLQKPKTIEEANKCRYAIDMSQSFRMIHPDASMADEIKFVEEELDKKFPKISIEDIPEKPTTKSPSVAGVGTKGTGSSGKTPHKRWAELSAGQQAMAKEFKRLGVFDSEAEYVESLIKSGDL